MNYDDDFDDLEDEEETTTCSIGHSMEEVCPECCSFGGWYSPGTETCDFCPWSDECMKFQMEAEKER